MPNKVIVVDHGYVMFTAIHVFRKTYAMPATDMYLSMILGYLRILGATLDDTIIIAQDSFKGSWRRSIYPEYKAQRKGNREAQEDKDWWDEVFGEFNDQKKVLARGLPWNWVSVTRMEADDIASVACRYYKDREVVLVSSDSDWGMLLQYPNVKILSIKTKKFKEVKDPLAILKDKIENGDRADNILNKPKSGSEWAVRKQIVSLLELPVEVENAIKWELSNINVKSADLSVISSGMLRKRLKKIYNI